MLAEATTAAQTSRGDVLSALRQASAATGSDFNYLLGTAMRESSLKPQAKSDSSSAAGLFQFVSQTWLGMVKQYGAKYGLGSYANAIGKGADGHYHVDNPSDRQAILALRHDAKVSALMAGEYANQTRSQLENRLGRQVCGGELYAAHFLGTTAACKLIEMNGSNPNADAAACFPAAAGANRGVFYNRDGSAKTVAEVYHWATRQPQVSQKVLAQAAATPANEPATVAPSATSPLVPRAIPSRPDDWSIVSLFADASASAGPLTSLYANAPLLQAPFALTPGVVSVLASLTPDRAPHDPEARKAA